MKVNLDEFNKRVKSGHIRKQTLDNLTIWNYSAKCAYDQVWDEYTTFARGLITESDGTIHSRSFPKFWNLNESHGPTLAELPKEDPVITLKLDGFLGISYWHNGVRKVASRGSFTSEYAVWATQWLHANAPDWFTDRAQCLSNLTYVFEILYPFRRIVVDNSAKYGLILLAVIDPDTGIEMSRFQLEQLARALHLPVVSVFPTHTLRQCVDLGKIIKGTECEGFVAHYPSTGLRVKIKGDDYCKIHKLVTRLTKRRIWEILAKDPETNEVADVPAKVSDDQLLEITSIVPEVYSRWIWDVATDLLRQHRKILAKLTQVAAETWTHPYRATGLDRKNLVFRLQTLLPDTWKEALAIADGYPSMAVISIWKKLEPEHEVPVFSEGDE